MGRGRGEGGCTQGCWLCSPPSLGKALAEVYVGLGVAVGCSLPFCPSFPIPARGVWGWPLRGEVLSQVVLLLLLLFSLEFLDKGVPKAGEECSHVCREGSSPGSVQRPPPGEAPRRKAM